MGKSPAWLREIWAGFMEEAAMLQDLGLGGKGNVLGGAEVSVVKALDS